MKKFFKGFYYAARGIALSSSERNMRVHFVASWAVIIAGIYFRLARVEWIILFFAIALVLCAEGFNTSIEYVINLIRDDCHVPYANVKLGKAKDIAAGAVFVVAIMSALIGALIFLPHIFP